MSLSDLYFHDLLGPSEDGAVERTSISDIDDSQSMIELRKYLELRSKQLQLDLDAAVLFKGKTETGTVAEDAIRRFLAASLPARYSVGLGEVISTAGKRDHHTQSKDVVIYDSAYSPVFGWGETGFHLFPIESVYAIIEVKKTVNTKELLDAMKQATEAKQLAPENGAKPFTAVIAFASTVTTRTLAKHISELPPDRRVDFVLILNPKPSKRDRKPQKVNDQSDYIAHWYYYSPHKGGGPVEFVTAESAVSEAKEAATTCASLGMSLSGYIYYIFLTWGRSEHALMWFYLFLVSTMNAMKVREPNLWEYAGASRTRLGYKGDFSP